METCAFCGAAYTVDRSVRGYSTQKYCSPRCRVDQHNSLKGYRTRAEIYATRARAQPGTKVSCAHCGGTFKVITAQGPVRKYCTDNCRALAAAARTRVKSGAYAARREKLFKSYGITAEIYNRMLANQGGVCAICKGPPTVRKVFYIDHNHKTGKVRGLLCHQCNIALGHIENSHKSFLTYLKEHDG